MRIDVGDALDGIGRAVERRGAGHVHHARWDPVLHRRSWRYQFQGRPECLVGEVLLAHGVGYDALAAFGERSFRELFVLRKLPVEVTLGAAVVLDRAQRVQDAGHSWGRAHSAAVRAAARYGDLVQAQAVGVRRCAADLAGR